jgi:hypothetical protein
LACSAIVPRDVKGAGAVKGEAVFFGEVEEGFKVYARLS